MIASKVLFLPLSLTLSPSPPSQGVVQLAISLAEETEDHVLVGTYIQQSLARLIRVPLTQAAACWALGQIGRHTAEHAKAVAGANVLPRLLELHLASASSEDLQLKVRLTFSCQPVPVSLSLSLHQSKRALKNILSHCTHLPALEPLLHLAPPNILKHVVGQFSKVLPHDPKARRLFVTSGGLKKVRQIGREGGVLCGPSRCRKSAASPAPCWQSTSEPSTAATPRRLSGEPDSPTTPEL